MNNPSIRTESTGFMIYEDDCRHLLPTIPTASIDAVITDPPYPHIHREYGYWTEDDWHALMSEVMPEIRRVLKPQGSAMFVLQPNMERIGRMRMWLWDFVSEWGREWNLVQDAYAWNCTAMPTSGVTHSLMRPSVRWCVWFGSPDCYRNQSEVLWSPSDYAKSAARAFRAGSKANKIENRPSGHRANSLKMYTAFEKRGGVTPFNVLPFVSRRAQKGESNTHGAQTSPIISNWWIRYICPPGGVVLDPFAGVASIGIEALRLGRRYIGIEIDERYAFTAHERLQAFETQRNRQ